MGLGYGRKRRKKGGGRPPRAATNAPRDLSDFLRSLVNDPEVQQAVRDHIVSGKQCASQLFLGAAAHVLGRPMERVRIELTPETAKAIAVALQSEAGREYPDVQPGMDSGPAALPQ